MSLVPAVAAGLFAASLGYWVAAILCSRRMLGAGGARRPAPPGRMPPVSILKPVKGTDFEGWKNFVSHCRQDYPDYEVLFGAADASDPAIPLIRRLQHRYGRERVRMVIAGESTPNPKAGLLHALASEARHDVLIATDSDVRVPVDFLRRAVPLLADPAVGVVTFPYRGDRPLTVPAALEALGIEANFLPSVAVGRRVLRAPFALGAANALRRDALARMGGFLAVSRYLADDYHLGCRIGAAGLRVEIGDLVVATVIGTTSLREWWVRQVRWARTIRASRRGHYPGLFLTFTTPLALIAWATAYPAAWSWAPVVAAVCTRWLVAWKMTGWTGHRALRRWLWLLPIYDLAAVAIWVAGLAGRTVRWRGRRFYFGAGGRLCAAPAAGGRERSRMPALRRAGVLFDRCLRRRQGIFEFTSDRCCLLRLAICPSDRTIHLANGERIQQGERIAVLHFWNERLPAFQHGCASLGWGLFFRRQTIRSLRLLADFVHGSDELADVRAVTAELFLDRSYPQGRLAAAAGRWGFDVIPATDTGLVARLALVGQSIHTRLIRYTFHGRHLGGRGAALRPLRLCIARDALMERYLTSAPRSAAGAGERAPAPVKK